MKETTKNSIANSNQKNKSTGFLNENFRQWPLWKNISPFFFDKNTRIDNRQQKPQWALNSQEISELPWLSRLNQSRSLTPYFVYYHCKLDNMTYFFQIGETFIEKEKKEIFEPPKSFDGPLYSIPTQRAKLLLMKQISSMK